MFFLKPQTFPKDPLQTNATLDHYFRILPLSTVKISLAISLYVNQKFIKLFKYLGEPAKLNLSCQRFPTFSGTFDSSSDFKQLLQ